jgi:CheY-like chemotaxis protein
LIVEDDPASRKVLSLTLESLGAEFACADDGLDGLNVFQDRSFDVVLMDLNMPVMDGFEAIRQMRSHEAAVARTRTPVVVVSAYDRPVDVRAAREAGADEFVPKPVDIQALMNLLAVYGKPSPSAPA